MESLLLTIARCSNVTLARCSAEHPCHKVVAAQEAAPDRFHLPEPWNGDLRSAPLLFVSSNPAIDQEEQYPNATWSEEYVHDYFTNRFGDGIKKWTKDANKALRVDGTYSRWSPFWSAIRARARELFEREVTPGRDFALTEIVRCKSGSEYGVAEASDECAHRYLLPTIEASGARVIVTLGKVAETYLCRLAAFEGKLSAPVRIGGRERIIAVLPHPNARQDRTFASCFDPEGLMALRQMLR